MIWLRLAVREIRNSRRFAVFFVLNLALGLVGFVSLDAYRSSIEQALHSESRELLGADLAVSASRPLSDMERWQLDDLVTEGARESQVIELYSMVAGIENSRLVEIRAIDRHFPFYGRLVLEQLGTVDDSDRALLNQEKSVWIDSELRFQLGVNVGDSVRIGELSFLVRDVVQEDSGRSVAGISLAPRVYIGLEQLEATRLIRKGSRVGYRHYIALPDDQDADSVATRLRESIADPGVKIQSHGTSSQEMARGLSAMGDFLGMVALVALFFAALSTAYLFRAYLIGRLGEVAILMSLGTPVSGARLVFVLQLLLLGGSAGVLAIGLSAVAVPLLPSLFGDFVPKGLEAAVHVRSVFVALLLAGVGSLLVCLPLLLRLGQLSPSALFQENAQPELRASPSGALAFLPAITLYWLLSVWQAQSLSVGTFFFGLLIVACLSFALLCVLLLFLAERCFAVRNLPLRLALRQLARRKASSFACFVALSLCAMLISVIPELRGVLETELTRPGGGELPSLFLFDIQEEQATPLQARLEALGQAPLTFSPLIRARLTKIDGRELGSVGLAEGFQTRNDDDRRWMRQRTYNLTIRAKLSDSERMTAGRPFHGSYAWDRGGPAEISVEEDFAERMGLQLGSTMGFDVQGVPVEAVVVSLRKVRWSSFDPNFFVQFQPGLLEEAPKTYIAAVPASTLEKKQLLQKVLVSNFPNVSIVDVSRVVNRVTALFEQMEFAMQFLSMLSVVAGFALLFSIAHYEAVAMRWELNLLKILGSRFGDLRSLIFWSFGILGLFATASGVVASFAISSVLAQRVLDTAWVPSWDTAFLVVVLGTLSSVLMAYLAARKVLRERALEILRSTEFG